MGKEDLNIDWDKLSEEIYNMDDTDKELDPNSVDGKIEIAFEDSETPIELKERLESIINDEYKVLEKAGYTDKDCIGDYWLIFETRPYMRARRYYIDLLVDLSMMKKAIKEGEELLRLCESDNLGVRYTLMHLYAYIEDEESAIKLCRKFTKEGEDTEELSVEYSIPLSILYFKKSDLTKAEKYLIKAQEFNENTIDFFEKLYYGDKNFETSMYGYKYNSIEQLEYMYESHESIYLGLEYFINWAYEFLDPKFL